MKIPFLDLKAQYETIKDEINPAIQNVLNNCNFIMGEDVKKLEEEVAVYCGVKYGIGVASGTDALLLALIACGIQDGDGVITTPFTFIATTEAISKVRGQIIFVDIDPQTYNLDPEKVKEYIEEKCIFNTKTGQLENAQTRKPIKAILPVHLYGHPVDLDPIMELAKKYNLIVIEDCAQAIGAEYKGKKVGSIGDVGCISFFPSKNLGCYGDGGMVVTNNEEIARKVRMLRVHGCETKYYHLIDGFNSRLDTLQAAVLRVKLKYLNHWNDQRGQKAHTYNELFNKLNAIRYTLNAIPCEESYAKHVFYAYTVRVSQRAELMEYLKNQGIPTMIYYPVPLHLQDVYKHLNYKRGDFPVSEQLSDEVLSLPIYPELTNEQQEYIVKKIGEFDKVNSQIREPVKA
jgi:dTDP-4-amino-4,6-dideoxygalactose transaminase